MRLNKRNYISEERGFDDLPPIFRPPITPRPIRPIPMKPLPPIPFKPDFGDEKPDMPPQFPPDADANGDGIVSPDEFLAYARQILRAAGFSEKEIKILLRLIRDGRSPTFGEKFRLRNIDQDLLRRLLKRIQREFPGGTPFVLPSDF
tara:strand:+ start:331 stop:771 length:441 start_codon:yes stop_codon:yes gene_type:complete